LSDLLNAELQFARFMTQQAV